MQTIGPLDVRIHTTPDRVRDAEIVIKTNMLKRQLSPGSERVLKAGLEVLAHLKPTPERNRLVKRVRNGAFGDEFLLGSPPSVKKIQGLLKGPFGKPVSLVVTQTNKASTTPENRLLGIDYAHIEGGEADTGFHFCPLSDPRRAQIIDQIVNPETLVMVGRFKGKLSTFFPPTIENLEELTIALTIPDWNASKKAGKNRVALCQIENKGKPFYVLQYLEHYGASIRTSYPLFYCKDFDEMKFEFSMPFVFALNKADVTDYLSDKVADGTIGNYILFHMSEGKLLVRLDGCPGVLLEKGVCIFINSDIIGYVPK